MTTDRIVWDAVIDAARMRWGTKRESEKAYERMIGRLDKLEKLENTSAVVKMLKDLIGDDPPHWKIVKGSKRVLEALELDLNVGRLESGELEKAMTGAGP